MQPRRKNTTIIPSRRRMNRLEDAERFFAPGAIVENPDWLVGAD